MYTLDYSGELKENRVKLPITIGVDSKRIFASPLGPFFDDTVSIIDNQNPLTPLTYGADYEFLYFYSKVSKKARGKGISGFVVIKNDSVSTDLSFEANYVGGPYVNQYELLVRVIEDLGLDDREVEYSRIEDTPDVVEAAPHLQDIGDVLGFEYIVSLLSQLVSVVSSGATPELEQLISTLSALETALNNKVKEHTTSTGNVHGATAAQVGAYTTLEIDTFFNGVRELISELTTTVVGQNDNLTILTGKIDAVEKLFTEHTRALAGMREEITNFETDIGEVNETITQLTKSLSTLTNEVATLKTSLEQNWEEQNNIDVRVTKNRNDIDALQLDTGDHGDRIVLLENALSKLSDDFTEFRGYTGAKLDGLDYRVTQLELNNSGGGGEPDPGVIKSYDWGVTLKPADTYPPGIYPITEDNVGEFNLDTLKGIVNGITLVGNKLYNNEGELGDRLYLEFLEITYGGSGDYGYFQKITVRPGHENTEINNAYFDYGHSSIAPLQLRFDNTGLMRDNLVENDVDIKFSETRLYFKTPRPVSYRLNLVSSLTAYRNQSLTMAVVTDNAVKHEWFVNNALVPNSDVTTLFINQITSSTSVATVKCKAYDEDGIVLESNTCNITLIAANSVPGGKHLHNVASGIGFKNKCIPGTYVGNEIQKTISYNVPNGLELSGDTLLYTSPYGEARVTIGNVIYDADGLVSATLTPTLSGGFKWAAGNALAYSPAGLINNLAPKTSAELVNKVIGEDHTVYISEISRVETSHQDVDGLKLDIDLSNFYFTIKDGASPVEEYNTEFKMTPGWLEITAVKGLLDNTVYTGGVTYDPATGILRGSNNEQFKIMVKIANYTIPIIGSDKVHVRQVIESVRVQPSNPESRLSLVADTDHSVMKDDRITIYGTQTRTDFVATPGLAAVILTASNSESAATSKHFDFNVNVISDFNIDNVTYAWTVTGPSGYSKSGTTNKPIAPADGKSYTCNITATYTDPDGVIKTCTDSASGSLTIKPPIEYYFRVSISSGKWGDVGKFEGWVHTNMYADKDVKNTMVVTGPDGFRDTSSGYVNSITHVPADGSTYTCSFEGTTKYGSPTKSTSKSASFGPY